MKTGALHRGPVLNRLASRCSSFRFDSLLDIASTSIVGSARSEGPRGGESASLAIEQHRDVSPQGVDEESLGELREHRVVVDAIRGRLVQEMGDRSLESLARQVGATVHFENRRQRGRRSLATDGNGGVLTDSRAKVQNADADRVGRRGGARTLGAR
jgi:hypothetical protein